MTLIRITQDVFDIAQRLQALNDDYVLYYNARLGRYEVHSKARGTLQFVLPYAELDARAVEYARKTAVCNADALFDEVERHNAAVRRQQISRAAQAVQGRIDET